ncbi:MAG: alpha-glucosidase [Propionibacteriaceae bacterium]|nr:alpha-glucosidase [Propionibacteriaceae bacterium]
MTNPPEHRPEDWWHRATVYQIYPRSFQDSNGDGVGDLQGIIARLDHLARLGIEVLWLSPIYRSPMVDNGYDISDYRDIDPVFGTLSDFDELLEQAHRRGIKVMMDLVVNHSSDQHPWFQASREKDSPYRDWYFWRPARPGLTPGAPGSEPDDGAGAFAPRNWHFDPASGEYYYGLFSPGQPDLNWENPALRQAVYELMRFWVERGVDGFRMDVINLISKPQAMTQGEVVAPGSSHWYAVANGPRLDEFLAEMNQQVGLKRLNLLTVGEMPGSTLDVARRATDPAHNELNMVFTFEHVDLDQSPDGSKWDLAPHRLVPFKQNLAHWQEGLAEAGWNSLYLDNHDQPRAVSRFGDDSPAHRVSSAKTLATVLHLHKGTPYVYQGEELGMTNFPFRSIDDYQDVESLNHHRLALAAGQDEAQVLQALATKGRDNARTPVQWDDSPHAGFTTGEPWLAVNPNHMEINAAAQLDDPDSVFHHYRRLIALRKSDPTVVHGRFELLAPEHEQLWAFTRTLDGDRLLVLANCSSNPLDLGSVGLPCAEGAELVLGVNVSDDPHRMNPWESRVLRLPREQA